jgi:hypothetical protein
MVTVRQIKKTGRVPHAKVSWLAPLPVWAQPGPAGLRARDGGLVGRPAILRFDHDDFMTEYLSTLNNDPGRLAEWLARPETWRAPMASPRQKKAAAQPVSRAAFLFEKTRRLTAALKPAAAAPLNLLSRQRQTPPTAPEADEEQLPLKLYQAGHNRHYLVTASLVCDEAGLPDCEPEPGRNEKATFIVRRLLPPADNADAPLSRWDEYAFVAGTRSSSWRRIGSRNAAAARSLITGEEQLPMFPVTFKGSCGAGRRLLNGVIPVSRREAWVGAPVGPDVTAENLAGATQAQPPGRTLAGLLLQADVAAPWKMLLERTEFKKGAADKNFPNFDSDDAARDEDRQRMLRTVRDEIQTGSWYVLLDFARFLHTHLPNVWQALTAEKNAADLPAGEQTLVDVLRATILPWQLAGTILTYPYQFPFPDWLTPAGLAGVTLSADTRYADTHLAWNLADALVRAMANEQGLEAVQTDFIRHDENAFRQAIDAQWPDFLFPLADSELAFPVPAVAADALRGLTGLERQQAAVDELARMIEALLPQAPPAEELVDTVPTGDQGKAAWFAVRCVYERPQCGPMFPTLVSAATRIFQMAAFFDPDAPARPVRIPMPADISVAGLRKYQKNTGFVISDMLCGKIKAIRKMTLADLVLSVLPWPFHKDLPDPGKTGPCKDGGTICSLSIPIVTLCALILMMIIVALFDLFFHWIPYLFICLPIPGLKGKSKNGEG